ncbi:MAG TPA: glycosyltransferase family 39 protein [Planctomycetaceae bacterium]|nr:glycosyltransferase family 39 protein [Planctomycetaceae bacterium]
MALALLSAIALMVPVWNAGPVTIDEHGSYWIIDADTSGGVWSRCLNVAATPPLFSWVQQACLAGGGKSAGMLRFPGVLGYLLAVLTTYIVGRMLDGPRVGGLAALVLAWHPVVVDEVRIGRCYGLLLWLCAVLLGTTLWWRRNPTSLLRAAVWSLSAAAVFWTHYLGAPLIAMSWLTVLWPRPTSDLRGQSFIAAILGGIVVAVACLPLAPAVERLAEWGPFLNYQTGTTSVANLLGPFWWLGLPLAIGVASLLPRIVAFRSPKEASFRGAKGDYRWTTAPIWMPVLWSLAPIVLLSAVSHGSHSSLANPRYRVPYAVGGACLFAMAVPSRRHPRIAIAGVTLALVATWAATDIRPWELRRLSDLGATDWQRIAEAIESDGQAGEPVFVQSGLVESNLVPVFCRDEPFLEYVACRASRFYLPTPHPRIGLPFLWDKGDVAECFRQRIATESANGRRVIWVACATDSDLCRASAAGIQQLLAEARYVPTKHETYPTAILQRWERPSAR